MLTGSLDGSIRLWNPRTGACEKAMQSGPGGHFHDAGVICLDMMSDSSSVISGGEDGSVFLSNFTTGKPLGELRGGHEEGDAVEVAGFCPHLPIAATGDVQGNLCLWDLNAMQLRSTCKHPQGKAVVRMRWHPTAMSVVTACVGACQGFLCVRGGGKRVGALRRRVSVKSRFIQ